MSQSILNLIPDRVRFVVDDTANTAKAEVYAGGAWSDVAAVDTTNGQVTFDHTATFNSDIKGSSGAINLDSPVIIAGDITLFTGTSYPGPDVTGPVGIGFSGRPRIADWGDGWLLVGEADGSSGGWAFGINAAKGEFATGTTDSSGVFSPRNYLDDGHRNMKIGGYLAVDSTASSTNGPTAGTVKTSSPFNGSAAKKAIFYFDGYENDTTSSQTIPYHSLTFSHSPAIQANNTKLTVSADTTSITVKTPDSTTTYTGWVIVSGF